MENRLSYSRDSSTSIKAFYCWNVRQEISALLQGFVYLDKGKLLKNLAAKDISSIWINTALVE